MYTVKSGDTLTGIARRHNIRLEDLLRLNPGIKYPDRIHPGDRIHLGTETPKPPAGAPNPSPWAAWAQPRKPAPLSDTDWGDAVKEYKIGRAELEAVAEVESGASAWLEVGHPPHYRPKILFEAHVFSRRTGGKWDLTHTNISQPRWNRAVYRGGIGEYARLESAMALDRIRALESASWGRFQIMGFNHEAAGFDTVEGFVQAMFQSERQQFRTFLAFLTDKGLHRFLRSRDWEAFAKGYNGPAAEQNRYAERLQRAYLRAVARLSRRLA